MICSQCGREIPDGSLSCNYCGKIFVSKRPTGGEPRTVTSPINPVKDGSAPSTMKEILAQPSPLPAAAVARAVKFRRIQRWFFYLVIVVIFVWGLFYNISISNDNSALLAKLATSNETIAGKDKEIQTKVDEIRVKNAEILKTSSTVEDKNSQLLQISDKLAQAQASIKDSEIKLKAKEDEFKGAQAVLADAQGVMKNLIAEVGIKIPEKELVFIPLAPLPAMAGLDTDKDGIPDDFETIIGTNPMLADTDKDGYADMDEINRGYNPLGKDKMPADPKIIDKYKGKIVLFQANPDNAYAWYVGMNGMRYYLGSSIDNYATLLTDSYWTR